VGIYLSIGRLDNSSEGVRITRWIQKAKVDPLAALGILSGKIFMVELSIQQQ